MESSSAKTAASFLKQCCQCLDRVNWIQPFWKWRFYLVYQVSIMQLTLLRWLLNQLTLSASFILLFPTALDRARQGAIFFNPSTHLSIVVSLLGQYVSRIPSIIPHQINLEKRGHLCTTPKCEVTTDFLLHNMIISPFFMYLDQPQNI